MKGFDKRLDDPYNFLAQRAEDVADRSRLLVEDEVKTITDYLHLVRGMNEEEFLAAFSQPVLVEKIGVFPQQQSLLSGTMLVSDREQALQSEVDSGEADLGTAKVFVLGKRPGSSGSDIFIGRAPTNDIILTAPSVSKSHAQFTPVAGTGGYQLVDMFSSNGTFLNGRRLHPFERHEIEDHDEIAFGPDYLLIYYTAPSFYELLVSLRL